MKLFLKFVTPLRIIFIIFLVITIVTYIGFQEIVSKNQNQGFDGLGFVIAGIISFSALIIDVICSLLMKPRKNWIVQLGLFMLLILWIIFN